MHNQGQLVEVHLILQQCVRVSRHLDKELVLEILGDFWIFKPVLVRHSLQQGYLLLMMWMEVAFIFVEECMCLSEELFKDHV